MLFFPLIVFLLRWNKEDCKQLTVFLLILTKKPTQKSGFAFDGTKTHEARLKMARLVLNRPTGGPYT